jgi:2-polyprenyl-6-methoxyphenol hydroxylase-like FAD-dependent oxidoreductase
VLFGTACVLGGSIAGLLAARVLADHAERVAMIERDAPRGRAFVDAFAVFPTLDLTAGFASKLIARTGRL